jgi:hypothetical protein
MGRCWATLIQQVRMLAASPQNLKQAVPPPAATRTRRRTAEVDTGHMTTRTERAESSSGAAAGGHARPHSRSASPAAAAQGTNGGKAVAAVDPATAAQEPPTGGDAGNASEPAPAHHQAPNSQAIQLQQQQQRVPQASVELSSSSLMGTSADADTQRKTLEQRLAAAGQQLEVARLRIDRLETQLTAARSAASAAVVGVSLHAGYVFCSC